MFYQRSLAVLTTKYMIMTVKFIRIFLTAVVLIMSLANIVFIVENWNLNVAETTVELEPQLVKSGEGRPTANQHVVDGE